MHTIMEQLRRSPEALEKHQIGKERCDTAALLSLSPIFPPSYIEFLTRYGGVKLFREGLGYLMIVLPTPVKVNDGEHGDLFRFGSYDDSYCYFSSASMKPNEESPVYALDDGEWLPIASSFSEWLTRGATALMSQQYSTGVSETAATFSEHEEMIVQLRKLFRWRIIGRTEKFVVINITNESSGTLNCITLGVRSIDRSLNGAVKVDVRDLAAGMSKNINTDCYSDLVHPSQVELFNLPEPTPGTRSTYFELR
jgi:hypothetical protein